MTLEELVNQVIANSQNIDLLREKVLELIGIMQEMTDEIKVMRGKEE